MTKEKSINTVQPQYGVAKLPRNIHKAYWDRMIREIEQSDQDHMQRIDGPTTSTMDSIQANDDLMKKAKDLLAFSMKSA